MKFGITASTMNTPVRVLFGVLGLAAFGAGVVAVFATANGTGAAALLVVGAALLVLALLGSGVESLEFGGATLRLRAAAADKFALAERLEAGGDTAEARRLRDQAEALMQAAGPIAAEYRSVRGAAPVSPERTLALEAVVARARELAAGQRFEPAVVSAWLRDGGEEERITALGMMQARPDLRDVAGVVAAVERPRSAFEQYQAMRLALEMIDDLTGPQRFHLRAATRSARGIRLRRDRDRWHLREEILRRLG